MDVAIGAIMKDEGPYIFEWVAYYRLLGFKIFIADNGGVDDTSQILKALHRRGVITRLDFRWKSRRPQIAAYRAIMRLCRRQGIEYLGFFDADEFFNKDFPLRKLDASVGASYIRSEFKRQDLSQLSFHWICFGGSERDKKKSHLVLHRFCTHALPSERCNVNVKSFLHLYDANSWWNMPYLGPAIFSVHFFHGGAERSWSIDGERVRSYDNTKSITHSTGVVLHYQIKTYEEYSRKLGQRKGASKRRYTKNFFNQNNFNNISTPVPEQLTLALHDEIERIHNITEEPRFGDGHNRFETAALSIGLSYVGGHNSSLYQIISWVRKYARKWR